MKRLTFLLMAAVFLLCSCDGNKMHGTAEPEVQPVMTLIDGVLKRDTTLWRSAFLPEYDAAMEAQELELGSCTDYNKYVASRLEAAMAANEDNYGRNISVTFTNASVRHIKMADRPDMFAEYKDIFTLKYRIDLDSIEDTAEVSGRIAILGKKTGSASDAVFVVVKCGGKWYLHPAFYNYMF